MKPVSGLVLGNRYRLVRQIAVGGMGEVWVAKDTALSRDVAVKVLREEFAGNEDFLERLRTEARNSASLSHRNIAAMFDYGEQRGSGYLVMELIHGEPMSDLLEREPVIPLARLLPILAQTTRALHAAHSSGVVHRDVKPGNILLDRSGDVKITDFGVSLAANQVPMTATGMVMGTAQYLSPEQAIGQPATGASDIYALGIVAYESVVGHRPFTGATPVDIAVAHVNEDVPPLPATVDRELSELIMVMLAKDPNDRPHPADALAEVLDSLAVRLAEDPWGRQSGRRPPQFARPGSESSAEGVRRRREDLAPVITPIVIPVAVREGSTASAAKSAFPAGGDAAAEATAGESPAVPALPWERPTPTTRSEARRFPALTSGEDQPRAYPPRRDVHARSTRRPSAPVAEDAGTRAQRRRATQAPPTRRPARRFPPLTWPLVALLVLLTAILIFTVVNRASAADVVASVQVIDMHSDAVSHHMVATPLILSGTVMTSLPRTRDARPVSGMIAPDMPSSHGAARTTSKDF